MFRIRFIVPTVLFSLLFLLSYCRFSANHQQTQVEGYWAQTDTVSYVGMNVCGTCHPSQMATYPHTGMGRSFGMATKERSDADYSNHPQVYDRNRDFYYRPFWRGDSLHIAEFRLEGKDTIHYLEQTIKYVIGSGQHTNSHIIDRKGYLYQAPITFYTQEGRWDLAPGFGDGHNTRFARIIETECMTCHNGLPEPLAGSLNGYEAVALGIDCERCHGPGAEHVRQKLAGQLVDTAHEIDYTIVNPGKLSLEAQLDLCQRCHLQGIAVTNDGSDWFDFQPGDRIKEHWNVFLPDFAGGNGGFLMASQAERLRKSACFVSTGGISCITCHNPHITVKQTSRIAFNKPCRDCHGGGEDCSASLDVRSTTQDDCSKCHMPRSGSVDIPHVTITDHKVSIPGKPNQGDQSFKGLECLTDPEASSLTMARGYLRFFEAFSTNQAMLDSALHYLQKAQTQKENPDLVLRTQLHLLYLKQDFASGAALVQAQFPSKFSDAWSCYRAGECLLSLNNVEQALPWLSRACELLPKHPDFRLKYANALASTGTVPEAMRQYSQVIREDPLATQAWSNMGFLSLQQGDFRLAENYLVEATRLDPDYLPARLHLAQLLLAQGRVEEGRALTRKMLQHHGDDPTVQALASRWQIQ
jgi:Tfp pilus assembly protein PilF